MALGRTCLFPPLSSDGALVISRGHLYKILSNPIYVGRLTHKGQVHEGLHDPIVDQETWGLDRRIADGARVVAIGE